MNTLRQRRALLGFTQAQLAEKLGTTQQTIARWESGKSDIPTSKLKELALLLHCRVDELISLERGDEQALRNKYSRARHGVPYGTLEYEISGGKIIQHPIDEDARNNVLGDTSMMDLDGCNKWISFTSLDNKLVFLNPSHTLRLNLISDDSEAMPNYEHPEVYKAMDDWLHGEFPGDNKVGERCSELHKELGDDDFIRLISGVTIMFADGREVRTFLEDDVASSIHTLEVSEMFGGIRPNAFLTLGSEGYYESHIFNLSTVASIEVPLEMYTELLENLEEDGEK